MGKIKGWTKVIDGKNYIEYKHKSKSSYYDDVRLTARIEQGGDWSITEFVDSQGLMRYHGQKRFKTKAEAKSYLMKYMRSHLNG